MKNGLDIDSSGDKRYYKDGLLHREDGPAIEIVNGVKIWIVNGDYHREDGPAIELQNYRYNAWYYHCKLIKCKSTEEFLKLLKYKWLI